MNTQRKSPGIDLTLILTGYNEGPELLKNLKTVKEVLDDTRLTWEVILWDDHSSDKTPHIFSNFAKHRKNVFAFRNEKNLGRGATVKRAMEKARGRIVGYIDTDLELSPVHISEFVRIIKKGADVVIAKRVYAVGATNFLRAVLSRGYVYLVRKMLDVDLTDTEAGFKFFDRRKILPVVEKVEDDRWFFDTEIVIRSVWSGLSVVESRVVYMYNPDKASTVNIFRDTIDYLRKLIVFKSKKPE